MAGFHGLQTRTAVDAARLEHQALRAQEEVLRGRTFDLAGQLADSVECRARIVRLAGTPDPAWEGLRLHLPARVAGDAALLAWLSAVTMQLV